MTELTQHVKNYWKYEYDVTTGSMVRLLDAWGMTLQGASVIDAGCAYGGCLCALHDQGARCVGFDVDDAYVSLAEQLRGDRAVTITKGDLYLDTLPFAGRQFDLVILHDVFEHLEQKHQTLEKLKTFMKPEGRILITFPPYYSAYGAHQQHLRAPYARIPFFHLLPFALSIVVPRLRNESPNAVDEVRKLGRLKMGMRKFERIVAEGGLRIERTQAYLISPNHIRFGLMPVPAGPVAHVPVIRELLCTGVVYLLSKE